MKESWMALLKDVKKTAPTHAENVQKAADWEVQLSTASPISEKSALLFQMFQAIPGIAKKARATSTKSLEKSFTSAMSDVAAYIMQVNPSTVLPEDVPGTVQIMRGYTAARRKAPLEARHLLAEVTQGMQAASAADDAIPVPMSIQSARELEPRLNDVDPKKFLDEAVRDECVEMVKGFSKNCVDMQPSVGAQTKAAHIIKSSMEH
eukprot:5401491-Pyramimonas_sp.AAC.1